MKERSKIVNTKVISRTPGGFIKELEVTEEALDGSGQFTHTYFLEHSEEVQKAKEILKRVDKRLSITGEDVAFDTVVFIKEPQGSVNRQARITKMKNGNYHVVNANMPYLGTINTIWTQEELNLRIKNKEIKLL